jgi:hypothetical protein
MIFEGIVGSARALRTALPLWPSPGSFKALVGAMEEDLRHQRLLIWIKTMVFPPSVPEKLDCAGVQ